MQTPFNPNRIILSQVERKQLAFLLEQNISKVSREANTNRLKGRENVADMLEMGIKEMRELRMKLVMES